MNTTFQLGLLLGTLALAAPAHAAETATDTDTGNAGTSLKVGIDAKTGKLRPLTEEESATLDALGRAKASQRMRGARVQSDPRLQRPATFEEAWAERVVGKNGMIGFRAPRESLSSLQVVRSADGTLTVTHDDQAAAELPHE